MYLSRSFVLKCDATLSGEYIDECVGTYDMVKLDLSVELSGHQIQISHIYLDSENYNSIISISSDVAKASATGTVIL